MVLLGDGRGEGHFLDGSHLGLLRSRVLLVGLKGQVSETVHRRQLPRTVVTALPHGVGVETDVGRLRVEVLFNLLARRVRRTRAVDASGARGSLRGRHEVPRVGKRCDLGQVVIEEPVRVHRLREVDRHRVAVARSTRDLVRNAVTSVVAAVRARIGLVHVQVEHDRLGVDGLPVGKLPALHRDGDGLVAVAKHRRVRR